MRNREARVACGTSTTTGGEFDVATVWKSVRAWWREQMERNSKGMSGNEG